MASWAPGGGGAPVRFDLGAQARSLSDSDAASEFNREFERYWAAVEFPELLAANTSFGFGADLWDSGRDRIVAGNVELSAGLGGWDCSLGSAFSLYQFDFYSARERTRVREHYFRARRDLGGDWRLSFGFGLEHDEEESYRTGQIALEVSF